MWCQYGSGSMAMGRHIGCGFFFSLAVALGACGSSKQTTSTPPDDRVCEAGARTCDGLIVKVCNEDGTAETVEETCLPSQSCSDGVCTETTCVPNTKFCKDSAIYKCDSSGGGSVLSQTCAIGKYCVEDDGDAECSDVACSAGAAMCDGTVATTCAADGSGPRPGGKDCAESDQTCIEGACREQTCTPGTKVCQHDDVYLCSNGGTDMQLLADCGVGETCDGDMGVCRAKLCEPGKVGCDASRIVECNDYGTGWKQAGTDCATDNQICIGGTCKEQTCTANATFCKDGNVYRCDADGISSNLYQNCTPEYYHCEPYPSSNYATCGYNQCQPGEKVCDNNVVKTCSANATLPATGTDCGGDNYCEDGTCKPRVCEPYEYYCDKGDVWYCDYFGGPQPGQQPQQVCPSDTACKKIENGVACVALPCEAGTAACLGNKVGTCASDGSSLSKVTDDCTTAGNICTNDAKCAKTAEDTVAVAESAEIVAGGEFIGNVFEATAGRKLTKIEMYLVLAAPRELRWVVYEQSGGQFIARIDKLISNQSGTGLISSGAMSYTLKAGKRYLVGVAVSGGDGVSYYDGAPWAPSVSFGSTLGYVHTYYASQVTADYLYSDRIYQMRVTTEAP